MPVSVEEQRLEQDRLGQAKWRRWGPYVSDRAWGTVREDYSPDGEAWAYFPHDHARSKAYRWGDDGIAGLCDRYQLLVFSLALWNRNDPILKERLFGLVPSESNHGEDVKEYYFHLDATPTHSYLKFLYKYPQARFPYQQLVDESRRRSTSEPEYELLDTGVFAENRYFDVFVEYAKSDPEDLMIRIEAWNRGPDIAPLVLLPHLWFRNTWAWGSTPSPRPVISLAGSNPCLHLKVDEGESEPLRNLPFPYTLGTRHLYAETGGIALFTENETNLERLYQVPNRTPFVKDAFHRHLIEDERSVNPDQRGSKACLAYSYMIPPGEHVTLRLRLAPREVSEPLSSVDSVIDQRRAEADEFYARIAPPHLDPEERRIQRQALAGLIWTKQIYLFDVERWLTGDNPQWPPSPDRKNIRNGHWRHLNSMRILTVPDKWEYPWFAAWDLALQCVPFALIDPEFAKEQLWLMLFEQFQHPNGQIPAYEWEFSDLNPPVHAWAVWRIYCLERDRWGRADRPFLEKCFHKLLMNFAWWVNKIDAEGNNVFEGGFLGLDNIALYDRSKKPNGGTLKQADATGWMGMFCLNLMRIALELSRENSAYQSLATKFFEHYVYIGAAMKRMGGRDFELWSERDGFFYDVLVHADGSFHKFRVRSLVGLIPLFAVETLTEEELATAPSFHLNFSWFVNNRPHLTGRCVTTRMTDRGMTHVLALVDESQLRRILSRVWDPREFRSPFGLRSLSKFHEQHPYRYGDQAVGYEPAEAISILKGGNSNWRGPIWFPTTFLMIESLRKLGAVYGDAVRVAAPGEESVTPGEMAAGFAERLIRIFKPGEGGRPVFGPRPEFQVDPYWRDHLLFPEYFHADTGEGLGATHQTGWTALVATLISEWRAGERGTSVRTSVP